MISLNCVLNADNLFVNLSMISFLLEGKFKNCIYSSSILMVSSIICVFIFERFTIFLNIDDLYSDKNWFHLFKKCTSKFDNDNIFFAS